jgi:hypothetical protein
MQSNASGLQNRPDSPHSKLMKLIGELAKAKSLPCTITLREVKRVSKG